MARKTPLAAAYLRCVRNYCANRESAGDFDDLLTEVINCDWTAVSIGWQMRRAALLNWLGRSKPFSIGEPTVLIDPMNAKLLVEALSGKWDWNHDRRSKQMIWSVAANALSLCISQNEEGGSPQQKIELLNNLDLVRDYTGTHS
jgi:hypothetical protein